MKFSSYPGEEEVLGLVRSFLSPSVFGAPGVKESWFGSGSLISPEGGSMDIRYEIRDVLSVNRLHSLSFYYKL